MNQGSHAGMGTRERVASEIKSFLVEHLFRGQPRSQGLSSSGPSERGETLLSRLGGKMRDPGNEVI